MTATSAVSATDIPATPAAPAEVKPAVDSPRAYPLIDYEIVDEKIVAIGQFGHKHPWAAIRRVSKTEWDAMQEPPRYFWEVHYTPSAGVLVVLTVIAVLCMGSYTKWNGISMGLTAALGAFLLALLRKQRQEAFEKRAAVYRVRADQAWADAGLRDLDREKSFLLPEGGAPLPPTIEGEDTFIAYEGQTTNRRRP